MVQTEASILMNEAGGTTDLIDFMQKAYNFENPNSKQLESEELQNEYKKDLIKFVNYWRKDCKSVLEWS